MKRINLLLFLLLPITLWALASCSKEDNVTPLDATFTLSKAELQFAK